MVVRFLFSWVVPSVSGFMRVDCRWWFVDYRWFAGYGLAIGLMASNSFERACALLDDAMFSADSHGFRFGIAFRRVDEVPADVLDFLLWQNVIARHSVATDSLLIFPELLTTAKQSVFRRSSPSFSPPILMPSMLTLHFRPSTPPDLP